MTFSSLNRRQLLGGLAASTVAELPPLPARPPNAQDLPWDGRLYGNPTHADTPSSTPIKPGEAVWLTVPIERTGEIVSIVQDLRAADGPEEVTGSPGDYSAGNGGRIRIQIRTLGPDGKPTATVLGQTQINNGWSAPLCVDGVHRYDRFAPWHLERPVPVARGQRVALWYENLGDGSNWVATNFMALYVPIPLGLGQAAGVYYGDACVCRNRRAWGVDQPRDSQGGYWELRYADGAATGNPYWFATGVAQKPVGGARMARQVFTVADRTRSVDGLWLRSWWHAKGTDDLLVDLERRDGSRLARLTAPRSLFTRTTDWGDAPPALWAYLSFDTPQTLEHGHTYRLRLSAPAGDYQLHPLWPAGASIDSRSKAGRARSRNIWPGSFAQYSEDGGASWTPGWSRRDRPGRYESDIVLSLAFTVRD